jgi:hypothetical protein
MTCHQSLSLDSFAPLHDKLSIAQQYLHQQSLNEEHKFCQSQAQGIITVFVDGSHFIRKAVGGDIDHDRECIGAGVYFTDPHLKHLSCAIPVPSSSLHHDKNGSGRGGSLRAELYASLLALHLLSENWVLLSRVRVVIKQDCLVAHRLLRECHHATHPKLAPSRWIREDEQGKKWVAEMKWGAQVNASDIAKHSDILDRWWMLTYSVDVRFEWVKAHSERPSPLSHTSRGEGVQELKTNGATYKVLEQDWLGNYKADLLAKKGALESIRDRAFCGLPLFPKDQERLEQFGREGFVELATARQSSADRDRYVVLDSENIARLGKQYLLSIEREESKAAR